MGKDGQTSRVRSPNRWAGRHRRMSGPSLSVLLLVAASGWGGGSAALILGGNFREVVPQRVYRSGQPAPRQLEAWIRRYQLRTIVNLRGPDAAGAAEEKAAAASLGADMVFVRLSAYRVMRAEELQRLIEVVENARPPILFHCRHGIDRAGTASAIAAWLLGGQTYRRAKWQAYVPPGPWKHRAGSGHISDTLARYEDYCRQRELNPDDPNGFKYWARNIYRSVPSVQTARRQTVR